MSAVAESFEVQRANRRFIKQSFRAPMLERDHEMALARRWRDVGATTTTSTPCTSW